MIEIINSAAQRLEWRSKLSTTSHCNFSTMTNDDFCSTAGVNRNMTISRGTGEVNALCRVTRYDATRDTHNAWPLCVIFVTAFRPARRTIFSAATNIYKSSAVHGRLALAQVNCLPEASYTRQLVQLPNQRDRRSQPRLSL